MLRSNDLSVDNITHTVGTSVIAKWGAVTPACVSNLLRRWPASIPQPDVEIESANGEKIYGWKPDREKEWLDFFRYS